MSERVLSIFIDESGDFGPYSHHAPYYLVSMILHDQSIDFDSNISSLDQHLTNLGCAQHTIHTGPIIRREADYKYDFMEDRKKLFNALFNFARRLDFHYIAIAIGKKDCPDEISLIAKLSREISTVLEAHKEYLTSFDQINIYYDNGQIELTRILTSIFNTKFSHVDFRKVVPSDYKLFQVADLVCTMELISRKIENNSLSSSEQEFFHSVRDFKKNYFKPLMKKRL